MLSQRQFMLAYSVECEAQGAKKHSPFSSPAPEHDDILSDHAASSPALKRLLNNIPLCMRQPRLLCHHLCNTWSNLLGDVCAYVCVCEVTENYLRCSEWAFIVCDQFSPVHDTHTRHLEGRAFIGVMTLRVYSYRDQQAAWVCACLRTNVCLQVLAFTHWCLCVSIHVRAFQSEGNKEIRRIILRERAFKSVRLPPSVTAIAFISPRETTTEHKGGILHWHMTDSSRLKGNSTLKHILCTGGLYSRHLLFYSGPSVASNQT